MLKFEIYRDSAGEFRWRLVGRSNRILADSGEGYKRKGACIKAIAAVKVEAFNADVVELEAEAVEVEPL